MINSRLSLSMMCADIARLEYTLSEFERSGVEFLHIDIMDGLFVPNITLGTDYVKRLRQMTDIPLDIHLMTADPENKLDWFDIQTGEIVSIHLESTENPKRALKLVKEKGARAFAALNPETPIGALDGFYSSIDGVLIMSVNPGFAGQKIIPSSFQKVSDLRAALDARGLYETSIEVDGNISFENAELMRRSGADIFVGGTSSVFKAGDLYDNVEKMRGVVEAKAE